MKRRKRRTNIKPQQIEAWVKRFFEYKRRSRGRQLAICNPFDGDDGFHFWISLEETTTKKHDVLDYYVHDWRHSRNNSSFIGFVKKFRNISYFEALKEVCGESSRSLRDHLRKDVQTEEVEEKQESYIKLPELSESFDGTSSRVRSIALGYLRRRGILEEDVGRSQLYYTPSTIVFPYIEYGDLVYWQERSFLDKQFNFPNEHDTGLAKTDFLYNFDNVEQPDGVVIIVESIIDCINIGDGCVATGGAIISPDSKQVSKLVALSPRMVILAPDHDKAGVDSLLVNYNLLKSRLGCRIGFAIPPFGEDWNDLEKRGRGEARKYLVGNSMAINLRALLGLREQVVRKSRLFVLKGV